MSIWAKIEGLLPRRVVRAWCKHPEMYVPVVPMMGPAPYQECPHCGHHQMLTGEDYRNFDRLRVRAVGATVVDMTDNLDHPLGSVTGR